MQPLQTLLVVDDDLDIRDALQDAFELEGYSVLLAADGLEALAHLRHEGCSRPHLILLDLMMPRMDGFAFREALRHDTSLSDIPVVVASADLHLESAAKQLDVAGCLRKPLDLNELLSTVKRLSLAG